jgi:hypothetical protein
MNHNKPVVFVESCSNCDKTIFKIPRENKKAQYERVQATVAKEVQSAVRTHGTSGAAMATISRLVEARMNIEDLVTGLNDLFAAERNKMIMENMPRWDQDSAMGRAEQILERFGVKFPNEIHHA